MSGMAEIAVKKIKVKKQKQVSEFGAAMRRLAKNKTAMIGLGIFVVLLVLAILSPVINPYDYATPNVKDRCQGPSLKHWFGTDELGRDIFSRIMYGGRYSLTIGLIATLSSMLAGIVLGAVAGFFGGWVDNLIMRFLDVVQSIPGLLLTICVSAALGTGFDKTILALSVSRIPGMARTLRASVMQTRNEEYVEAAGVIGCGTFRTIVKYVLPNSFAPLLVSATMGIANTILTTASLSYIGLGIQPPTPEWGAMLSAAKKFIRDYPYMLIFPGLFIAITVLSLNMLGDGLRDALDPKLKD